MTARTRHGYTLIELLVTIGIIAILLTITLAVFGGKTETARVKATLATITKINNLVTERVNGVNRSIEYGELKDRVDTFTNREYGEAIVRKEALKLVLPQTFAETDGALSAPAGHDPATESAEVLYWAVTQGTQLGLPAVSGSEFGSESIGDTDGDGLQEFIDGWGRPLRFYRWPTRLVRPDGTTINEPVTSMLIDGVTADMLGVDPDDPKGVGDFTSYHTASTYHTPLVVSAGADGDFGLNAPNDVANAGNLARPTDAVLAASDPGETALNDNITNRQRVGDN